jgi:selenium metabolism protein YedF
MTDRYHLNTPESDIDGRALHLLETLLAVKSRLSDVGTESVTVMLESEKARDDLSRFAEGAGYSAQPLGRRGDDFLLHIQKGKPEEKEQLEQVAVADQPMDSVLLISSETVGSPDESLGRVLMKKLLYSLTETEQRPTAIVIVSAGVRLAVDSSDSIEALRVLEDAGVDVMVCGASVEFLKLKGKIAVGRVCDMYQIVERLLAASKTISI